MRRGRQLFEARVDLAAGKVLSFNEVAGAQSSILLTEWALAQEIVKGDDGWKKAMRKRGYRRIDPDQFNCLPLAAGYFAEAALEGRRLLRVQCMDLEGTQKNVYQRPIEGLTMVVDLHENSVVEIVDEGVVPVPPAVVCFAAALAGLAGLRRLRGIRKR